MSKYDIPAFFRKVLVEDDPYSCCGDDTTSSVSVEDLYWYFKDRLIRELEEEYDLVRKQ